MKQGMAEPRDADEDFKSLFFWWSKLHIVKHYAAVLSRERCFKIAVFGLLVTCT